VDRCRLPGVAEPVQVLEDLRPAGRKRAGGTKSGAKQRVDCPSRRDGLRPIAITAGCHGGKTCDARSQHSACGVDRVYHLFGGLSNLGYQRPEPARSGHRGCGIWLANVHYSDALVGNIRKHDTVLPWDVVWLAF
jgi:hypothetical protein